MLTSIAGTKWRFDGNPYIIEFLPGGAMTLDDYGAIDHVPPGNWTQSGQHVTIHIPFMTYEMTLAGDSMSGTQQILKSQDKKPAKGRRVR